MNNFTKFIKSALSLVLAGFFTLQVNAQNNALDFDGVDDYVQIPYSTTYFSQIISVQISAVVDGNNGQFQAIYNNGGNPGTGYTGFGLYALPDDHWYILFGNGGTSPVTLQGPLIDYGTWTNLAGTYDGSTLRFYVNGVLVNSLVTTALPNTSLPLRLGAGNSEGAPKFYFKGRVDELRLWKTVLTPAQIISTMNGQLTGTETNLVGYFNFNEGIANGDNTAPPVNTLNDVTTHLPGTLSNFALNNSASNWVNSEVVLLPINLVNFEGSAKDGSNNLQWSTASEQNSSYFEVQRSTDGVNFSGIGKVTAAGNSDGNKDYSYSDNQLSSLSPVYYYRLKMVDIDGSAKYSPVIHIKNNAGVLAKIYPNPARDQFTITIKDNSLLNTQATLSDMNGKVLQKISITQSATRVNVSTYVKGVYILKFKDGTGVKVIKE